MADYDQLMQLEKKPKGHALPSPSPSPEQAVEPTKTSRQETLSPAPVSPEKSMQQETHQSLNRSTRQSTKQSTKRLTKQSIGRSDNRITEKPKGFYITQRLDKRLDEAVRYLQEVHGIKKADRSTIVNAILDNEANWTEESLDLLVDRVISLLTSRLMS